MTTTVAITSTTPLQVTVTTDQHMIDLAGTITATVGADVIPFQYNQKEILHPVDVADPAHTWTLISDDQGVPTSKIVLGY